MPQDDGALGIRCGQVSIREAGFVRVGKVLLAGTPQFGLDGIGRANVVDPAILGN